MAKTMTERKTHSRSRTRKNDGLPPISLPGVREEARKEHAGAKDVLHREVIDFDNEKLKGGWQKIIDSQRKRFETDVIKISPPRTKLDPIAKTALDRLPVKLLKDAAKKERFNKVVTPAEFENKMRAAITQKGLASEVKKVTDRLNARRMTDGRRWVLATTYIYLLADLFDDTDDKDLEEVMKDDLGVAERIMLDLEAKGGPIDVYTNLIVKSVMDRNRIHPSRTLLQIVSQQVRAAI
jgi:hypothetical protein